MMMKHVCEHWLIHIERSSNAVGSMPLPCLFQSQSFTSKYFTGERILDSLVTVRCLGSLNYIRLWHDNAGKGSSASWFLKYIIIHDLQTMQKSYFIAQRWFAVEKEDGLVSA